MTLLLYLSICGALLLASLRGLTAVPTRWYAIVCLVAVLAAIGQAIDRPRLTYPFVSWKMYARPAVPRTFQRYYVTDDRRIRGDYPFAAAAFSEPRALLERVSQIVQACDCSTNDPTVDSVVIALGAIYRRATGRAMIAFDVYDVSLTRPTGGPGEQRLRYSWSVD